MNKQEDIRAWFEEPSTIRFFRSLRYLAILAADKALHSDVSDVSAIGNALIEAQLYQRLGQFTVGDVESVESQMTEFKRQLEKLDD